MSCEGDVPIRTAAIRAWKCLKRLPFCRRATRVLKWLGGRESLPPLSETPTKTSVFNSTRMMSANWRLRILSPAPACLLPFSAFASAMTLEMSLAANASGVPLVGNSHARSPRAVPLNTTTSHVTNHGNSPSLGGLVCACIYPEWHRKFHLR
jgi:hypothetical protein